LQCLFLFGLRFCLLSTLSFLFEILYHSWGLSGAPSRVEQAELYEILICHQSLYIPFSYRAAVNLCMISVKAVPLVLGGIPMISKQDMLVNMSMNNHMEAKEGTRLTKNHPPLGEA